MSDDLQFKYEVEIKTADKKQKLTNEVKDELKASGMMDEKGKLKISGVSAKMLKRMKREAVDCPLVKDEVAFLACFACGSFIRRFKGTVHCAGIKPPVL